MTVSVINPFLPPPPEPNTSLYGKILDAVFGHLNKAEQQKIWVEFLTLNGLTEPVPPGSEELFYVYLNQVRESEKFAQRVYVNDKLPPEEIKKRNIMFEVLKSVVDMLLSLQSTVTVQAQSIAMHARWQKEYTNMLTRVPTLVGGESSAVKPIDVNALNPDWSKFTFGYGDISVQDMANWWADQRVYGKNDIFTIESPGEQVTTSPIYAFTAFGFTFKISATEISFYPTLGGSPPSIPFYPTLSIPIASSGTTFDQHTANFQNAFKTFWNTYQGHVDALSNIAQGSYNYANLNMLTIDPFTTDVNLQKLLTWGQIFTQTKPITDPWAALEILKPYTYVAPSGITAQDNRYRVLAEANAKARGEINSKEQQYIENVRSKRQIVQDTQSALQANLDQSRQTLSQQSDLLTSVIDSLKGLLSSIFR